MTETPTVLDHQNHFAVILAGGRGTRLWPASREARPKQFIDFFGTGHTQLQSTYLRLARLLPASNILVTTLKEYAPIVREQLPDLQEENLLVEPIPRNTAPVVGWAAAQLQKRCPEGTMVVVPSDQLITDESVFLEDLSTALHFVQRGKVILTMGITPTRPEPGYGYIQMGDEHPGDGGRTYWVKSFTEKPEREFAQMFMQSGEFLWNTGVVVAGVDYLYANFTRLFPEYAQLSDGLDEHLYSAMPNASLDRGVLERAEHVCVMRCRFGWADLGSWHSVYESRHHTEGDNVVASGEALLSECHGCVVRLSEGRVGIINGLTDCIVVEQDDVLLICKRADSSQLIKKYAVEVPIKYGQHYA